MLICVMHDALLLHLFALPDDRAALTWRPQPHPGRLSRKLPVAMAVEEVRPALLALDWRYAQIPRAPGGYCSSTTAASATAPRQHRSTTAPAPHQHNSTTAPAPQLAQRQHNPSRQVHAELQPGRPAPWSCPAPWSRPAPRSCLAPWSCPAPWSRPAPRSCLAPWSCLAPGS